MFGAVSRIACWAFFQRKLFQSLVVSCDIHFAQISYVPNCEQKRRARRDSNPHNLLSGQDVSIYTTGAVWLRIASTISFQQSLMLSGQIGIYGTVKSNAFLEAIFCIFVEVKSSCYRGVKLLHRQLSAKSQESVQPMYLDGFNSCRDGGRLLAGQCPITIH